MVPIIQIEIVQGLIGVIGKRYYLADFNNTFFSRFYFWFKLVIVFLIFHQILCSSIGRFLSRILRTRLLSSFILGHNFDSFFFLRSFFNWFLFFHFLKQGLFNLFFLTSNRRLYSFNNRLCFWFFMNLLFRFILFLQGTFI